MLARPLWATAERQRRGMTPTSGSPIKESHAKAIVSAIKRRLRRSGQRTCTRDSPKRLLASLKDWTCYDPVD